MRLLFAFTFFGHEAVAQTRADDLTYRVIDLWKIPNGGFGQVIVVSRVTPNENELRALGERLKQDTKSERNAFIFVYDDERAARLRRAPGGLERLSKEKERYHDRHYLALYMRNANTGYHVYEYYPKGFDDPAIKIQY